MSEASAAVPSPKKSEGSPYAEKIAVLEGKLEGTRKVLKDKKSKMPMPTVAFAAIPAAFGAGLYYFSPSFTMSASKDREEPKRSLMKVGLWTVILTVITFMCLYAYVYFTGNGTGPVSYLIKA